MAERDHEVVTCEGEWDISRAEELAVRASAALERGTSVVILDFRPSGFADASTVAAIFYAAREAAWRGSALVVTCGPGPVQRLFDLMHLGAIVSLAPTVEDALQAAGGA